MEKIPLIGPGSRQDSRYLGLNEGYLLLSMPRSSQDKTFIQRLGNLGNHASVIVGVSAIVLFILLIAGIAYHADLSPITYGQNGAPVSCADSSNCAVRLQLQPNSDSTEIEIPLGRLRGYIKKSRKGRDFLAFYKVPYAKPPVGKLRFKDPQPVEKWEGLRDFPDVAPQCVQRAKNSEEAEGDEDCLYMNIYTPKVPDLGSKSTVSYPTMVYIHGGIGFWRGNGSRYGAEYFMDEDVVLITFQFRLGLFGFLNTGDGQVTGNMSFKDQVMVLKWVNAYIKHFGGDPSRVVVFGNSSGGFSVSFLMISPMAEGLFHGAISQSGTALSHINDNLDLRPEDTVKAAAERFNCSQTSSTELLNCLQTKNAREIGVFRIPETKALTVEKSFDATNSSDIFMPDKPYNLLKSGKVNRVPYIIGVNSAELIPLSINLLEDVDTINNLNANFSQYAPALLDADLSAEESQLVKQFYFGDNQISNDTERNLTNLLSDRTVVHGCKLNADMHSRESDTYLYYLSKRPLKSYADKALQGYPIENEKDVAAHADEIQFLFPYDDNPIYSPTDTEYFPFSETMVKLWVNFAANGRPVTNAETEEWIVMKSDPEQNSWYELSDSLGMTTVLNERMKFWDQFSHKQLKYEL